MNARYSKAGILFLSLLLLPMVSVPCGTFFLIIGSLPSTGKLTAVWLQNHAQILSKKIEKRLWTQYR